MARPLTDVFADGMWRGRRAFVVGGGPSLKGFDWTRLSTELVIAVNRAYETLPFAPIVFSMDNRFWIWNHNKPEFQAHPGFKVWLNGDGRHYPQEVLEIHPFAKNFWAAERAISDSLEHGLGHGVNSGYAAMNLAMILGADPVYLLGIDLHGHGMWWHEGYGVDHTVVGHERMRDAFEWAARSIRTGRVVNCNPESAVRGFPFQEFGSIPELPEMPLFVSYYTPIYEPEAEGLRATLRRMGIEHCVVPMKDHGTWQRNTQYKPKFIKEMMELHAPRPIVWVDADARIQRFPELLQRMGDADVGVHFFRGEELLSGTVYLANNDRARALVDRWIVACDESPTIWDQKLLWQAMEWIGNGPLKIERLPASYCYIFDLSRPVYPGEEPVIEHFQASRRLRT